ncbi:hypothetical protein ACQPZZ_27830 [Microbispora sp. CA-135349]
MNRLVKHLLIAALIGSGLVAGNGLVTMAHHAEPIVAVSSPVGSCC